MSSALIYRPSLGHIANLGDLYDARTDNFCGYSMLRGKLPPDSMSSLSSFSQHAEVFVTESSVDRSKKFDISPELQLGVHTNLVKLDAAGSAGYMTESRSSRKALQAVLAYDVTTDVEKINVNSDGLIDCLALDVLEHCTATHVVVGVHWGAKARLTITDENVNESEKKTIKMKLEATMKEVSMKLTNGEQMTGLSAIDSSFKMEMFSDIRTSSMPTTFVDAVTLMSKLPGQLLEMNNGRGKPINYDLFPLDDIGFRKHVGLPIPAPFATVKPLDKALVDAFLGYFDEVSLFRNHVQDYSCYIQRCRGRCESLRCVVQDVENNLARMETKMRKQVGQLMVSVRSGAADATQLQELLGPAKDELALYEGKLYEIINKPEYVYSVEVVTGSRPNAGTDSNVFIKLFDKYSVSGDIMLVPSEQKQTTDCFNRKQKDVFTIVAPLLLRLTKLRIWHDNTGNMPDWYLKKVVVCDITSHEEYEFLCDKWIQRNSTCDLLPSNTVNSEPSKQQQQREDNSATYRSN